MDQGVYTYYREAKEAIQSPFYKVFGPGGLLQKALPLYEYRPAQLQMAHLVADAMHNKECALIEAGTGTGKTIAYLVPIVLLRMRCVISTGTKNLQDQLVKKDIPILERCLDREIRAFCLKGRGNYLCLRRWKQFLANPGLALAGTGEATVSLKEWLSHTETGERNELSMLPEDHPLWQQICSTTETCMGQRCHDYERCYMAKARQEAAEAEIVVVNHHLLMADCCLRMRSKLSAIPNYFRLIIDEAHMLEQIATEYFGVMASNRRIQDLISDIRRETSSARIADDTLNENLEQLTGRSFAFFESLPYTEERFTIDEHLFSKETRQRNSSLISSLSSLSFLLEGLGAKCDALAGCRNRSEEIRSTLNFLNDRGDPDYVFWGERKASAVYLRVSPIDVSQELAANLFKPLKGLVLTSATLATDESFEYIRTRLGVTPACEQVLESHFDYKKQAVILIPKDMPNPASTDFTERLGPEIKEILRLTKGRAFILFTSYKNMEDAYRYLKGEVSEYRLLKQGDRPKEYILEEFCKDISSVLLATNSFWQGVDVPGEALSCVIIDRLPFAVPTDPIVQARIKWISERGGNPFHQYQLPSTIISLKQGLGRLIRHRGDRGLLVILDSRVIKKSYGRAILKNLPKCPVTESLEEAEAYLKRMNMAAP